MSNKPTIIMGDIIITPFLKAKSFLDDALKIAKSPLEQTGCIQAFEFCFELSWKVLKRILAKRGVRVNSPREVFRAAAQEQLIDDAGIWFEFIDKRNLTSHTYNEDVADEIFQSLTEFQKELDKLSNTLLSL